MVADNTLKTSQVMPVVMIHDSRSACWHWILDSDIFWYLLIQHDSTTEKVELKHAEIIS
jgi:hypothetical protein